MRDLPGGKETRFHVMLEWRVAISSTTVCCQPGWERASPIVLEMETYDKVETNLK